ncbi:hypothetical protein [Saccharothrix stipae]
MIAVLFFAVGLKSLAMDTGSVEFPAGAATSSSVVDNCLVGSRGTAPRLLVSGATDYASAVARPGRSSDIT